MNRTLALPRREGEGRREEAGEAGADGGGEGREGSREGGGGGSSKRPGRV